MPRQLITITHQQKEWLNAEARRLGISITEVLRRLIDRQAGFDTQKQGTTHGT